MAAFCSHLASHSVVIDIVCAEYRCVVSRTERLELLEDPEEFRAYLGEVEAGIDIHYRGLHLRDDRSRNSLLDSFTERRDILLLERETCSIEMASEVLQQVRTALDGVIKVKAVDASCRTGHQSSLRLRKHDRRLVEGLNKT